MSKQNTERIVYITDLHLRLTTPSSRKDNYLQQSTKVLKWIIRFAEKINATAIVHGGDIGDSWDWKISLIKHVSDLLRSTRIPFYSVIGNHDLPGKNYDELPNTAISLLADNGLIKIISPDLNNLVPTKIGKFDLYGFHADHPRTEQLLAGKINIPKSKKSISIAVVHAAIGAEDTPYCRGVQSLFIPDFDFACFGDIHTGWSGFESLSGCVMLNPGSTCKLKKSDIGRTPRLVVIDSNKQFVERNLPYFDDADLFNLTQIDEDKSKIGKAFLINLASRTESYEDPVTYLSTIAKECNTNPAALQLLLDEIKNG